MTSTSGIATWRVEAWIYNYLLRWNYARRQTHARRNPPNASVRATFMGMVGMASLGGGLR